jgi:hypothetical protein
MLYITKDNVVHAEPIKPEVQFIEKGGGYYIAPINTVYREKNRKDESIAIVVQDRIMAFGMRQDDQILDIILQRIDAAHLLKKKLEVDNAFSRWFKLIMKSAGPIILILIGAGIFLSMIGGGA